MSGRLFVVSAPSGAGKTSLVQSLVEGDDSLVLSVSHTTRPKRTAETDGVHYHFVDARSFAAMREAGEFLECANVYGHSYGTSRRMVLAAVDAGRDVVLEIDWQGAAQVRECWPNPIAIFVLPPSRRVLLQRLTDRAQDRPEVIAKRTAVAIADLSHYCEFDHLVVNDDFDTALGDLQRIVKATRRGESAPSEDHSALLQELLSRH